MISLKTIYLHFDQSQKRNWGGSVSYGIL